MGLSPDDRPLSSTPTKLDPLSDLTFERINNPGTREDILFKLANSSVPEGSNIQRALHGQEGWSDLRAQWQESLKKLISFSAPELSESSLHVHVTHAFELEREVAGNYAMIVAEILDSKKMRNMVPCHTRTGRLKFERVYAPVAVLYYVSDIHESIDNYDSENKIRGPTLAFSMEAFDEMLIDLGNIVAKLARIQPSKENRALREIILKDAPSYLIEKGIEAIKAARQLYGGRLTLLDLRGGDSNRFSFDLIYIPRSYGPNDKRKLGAVRIESDVVFERGNRNNVEISLHSRRLEKLAPDLLEQL